MENNKWDFIEINWEKYNETYKELWTNAILNGYTIPILLDYDVPTEYDFKVGEQEKIRNKVTKENNEKLTETSKEIRRLEIDHDKGKVSDKELKEYLINELKDFLKAFPQYNDLIVKWNDEIINAI